MPWHGGERVYFCKHCKYRTGGFYNDTRQQEWMHNALLKHLQDLHTCQYCGAVGMKGKGLKIHEEACLRKQELKAARKASCEAMQQEVADAREAMLLICLADEQTPIATLTDDALKLVFQCMRKDINKNWRDTNAALKLVFAREGHVE